MPPALTHDQCRREIYVACGGRAGPRLVSAEVGSARLELRGDELSYRDLRVLPAPSLPLREGGHY